MAAYWLRAMVILFVLVGHLVADDSKLNTHADDMKRLDGFWSGAWGGGESNGTVFQPVIAEMLIWDGKIELSGFRGADRVWGLVRIDPTTKSIKITSAKTATSPSKVIEYTYELTPENLVMNDRDQVPVHLSKRPLELNPVANVQIEIVLADTIDERGHLKITQFTELKFGRVGTAYYEAETRALKTDGASAFVVEETGMKKITINDARKLLKPSDPVAIAYRNEVVAPGPAELEFHRRLGRPRADSEAVLKTLTRTLRTGTLVFVLPAALAVPEP